MQNLIIFDLNGKEFKFPCSFKLLKKLPPQYEHLSDILISQHRYNVQSPVKNETFQNFLEAWKNETTPEINSANIWEFYLLSQEFGIFSDYISSPKFQNMFNISSLFHFDQTQALGSQFTKNIDKSHIERHIAINLNEYLDKMPNELFQIPINSLYNIFNHPEKNLEDHEKAYQLILKSAEQNTNLYVILNCIDGSKIKSSEIRSKSVLQRDDHFGFFPQNVTTDEQIEKLKYINIELTTENNTLKKENNKLTKDNDHLKSEIHILTTKNHPDLGMHDYAREIYHFIENYKEIEHNSSMTKVIVMGSTGCGKSCIINSLLKKPLKISEGRGRKILLEGEGVSSGMAASISPKVLADQKSQLILYECSLNDCLGLHFEIFNSFIIDKLVQKINNQESKIKILLVFTIQEIEAARGRSFKCLIERIKVLFNNYDQIKEKIGFILTRTDESNDADEYISYLIDIFNNSEYQDLFKNLNNIFVYPRPKRSDVGKYYHFQDNERLTNFVHTDPIVNLQANISLSKEALLEMLYIRNSCQRLMMEAVTDLGQQIRENLASVTNLKQIELLIDTIRQINAKKIHNPMDFERIIREKIPNADLYYAEISKMTSFEPFYSFLNKAIPTLDNDICDPNEVTYMMIDFIKSWKTQLIADLQEKEIYQLKKLIQQKK